MSEQNKAYGLDKVYQHDLDNDGVCKKCHQHVSKLKLKLCAVIGEKEVAKFRHSEESWNE